MFSTANTGDVENRVLFVDDDKFIRKAFERDIVPNLGHEVVMAGSGEEGLEMLESESFGVILTDYEMPGMNGLDFLERARGSSPDSARILVTGMADLSTAVQVINGVGLFSMVLKPWDPMELRAIVSRAMEHHRLIVENQVLTLQLAEKVAQLGTLNSTLEAEVNRRTKSFLLGLTTALDLRDTETQCHSRRVALYAKRLAQQLNLDPAAIIDVEHGALLHDIGKIGVSDTILLKPGKLTEEEWEEMRRHSEYGYRIIKDIPFLGDARRIVLQHHERWDGQGYPGKLKGEQIHIGARIFAVIDTYDAMTSDRPYRKALPHEVAVEELIKMRGSQFDPCVVDAWLDIPESEIRQMRDRVTRRLDSFS